MPEIASELRQYYCKIYNNVGLCVAMGDAYTELRKFHNTEINDDEIIICLRQHIEEPVRTALYYRDPIEGTNWLQELPIGHFFPWKKRLLVKVDDPQVMAPEQMAQSNASMPNLTADDSLPMAVIMKDPKLAMEPFSEDVRHIFLEYTFTHENRFRFSGEKYDDYIAWLSNPTRPAITDAQKSHKNKAKANYIISNNTLYRRNNEGSPLQVVQTFQTFDYIAGTHKALLHKGVTKTYESLSQRYYGITRDEVKIVLRSCKICALNRPTRTRAPLQPIHVDKWLEHIQIDLIDMRHEPDEQYKWICHIKDHFSKYSVCHALRSKSSQDVANVLCIFLMYMGPPEIMQADNGKEFKGAVTEVVRRHGIKVKNGRPRTPHVQGLVEQGNGSIESSIRAWKSETGRSDWSTALTEVAWSMNGTWQSAIKTTPYEVVFGRKFPWSERIPLSERALIEAEDEPATTSSIASELVSTIQNRELEMSVGEQVQVPELHAVRATTMSIPNQHQSSTLSQDAEYIPIDPQILSHTLAPTSHLDAPDALQLHHEFVQQKSLETEKGDVQVRVNSQASRQRMSVKYNKKIEVREFSVGDYVTLKVNRLDRSATDPHQTYCRIVSIPLKDRHQLRSVHGLIKGLHPTKELEALDESIQKELGESIPINASGPEITLHRVATLNSTSTRITVACNCKGQCNTRICRCFKNDIRCSIHCHPDDHECDNMSALAVRTEIGLMDRPNSSNSEPCPEPEPASMLPAESVGEPVGKRRSARNLKKN